MRLYHIYRLFTARKAAMGLFGDSSNQLQTLYFMPN